MILSLNLMDGFSYSVVIRTLGNTGEKYRLLLEAVAKQTVKPMEVVVVIPYGYTLDHQLGNERVIFSEKGMVTQRVVGMSEAHGDYLLVLDDDVVFPADFVEKMHSYLEKRDLDGVLAFGKVNSQANTASPRKFKQSIKEGLKRIRGAFTGQYFYSRRKSDFFDVITRTAGHKTFVNEPDKLCQTGCFQCFFMKKSAALEAHFDEEKWLEQGTLSRYAAYDDAVFFYKLFVAGKRVAYTNETDYAHLDAAMGRSAANRMDAKRIRLYCIARNRTVFWKRHILAHRPGLLTWVCGVYGLVNYALFSVLANILPHRWPAISALFYGYRDAFKLLRRK